MNTQDYDTEMMHWHLTLLHSERPKLYAMLAFLSAGGLINCYEQSERSLFPARTGSKFVDEVPRVFGLLESNLLLSDASEEGQYVMCDKCHICYHPSHERLTESEIPLDTLLTFVENV